MDKPTIKTQSTELSNDINVITAEINAYKRVAGEAIFEIGRRLKHVRETIFKEEGHLSGKWAEWCEEIEMDITTAKRFIRVYEELGSNRDTWHGLSMRVLYEISTLPPEEREKPHVIPSTGAVKTVDEMTVRELREVKAALKEAERAKAEAENRAKQAEKVAAELAETNHALKDTIESLSSQPPKVEYVPDPVLSDRLKRYEAKYGDIDGVVTQRISNHIEVDGAAAHFADDVQTFLMNYAHLTTFKAAFVGISDEAYENYVTSLDALKQFVNGMQRVLDGTPRGKAEVIDIADYRAQ